MMRWGLLCLLLTVAGCAQTRTLRIVTQPSDATIKIDGIDQGSGPLVHDFTFNGSSDIHRVSASRAGYKTQSVAVTPEYPEKRVMIRLKPLSRKVTFNVSPVPAIVKINGKALSNDPVRTIQADLEFTLDAQNNWTTYKVSAERVGYQKVERTISWTDREPFYLLDLEAMCKDLTITSTPSGAEVFIDGESYGPTTMTYSGFAFPVDPETNEWIPHDVRISKPGYNDVEFTISWDDGKTEYHSDLTARSKDIVIKTNPPGAIVKVEGAELKRDKDGNSIAHLEFPPVSEKGELKSYAAEANKKTAESEWEPARFKIDWDNGKADYTVALKEIKTRQIPLVRVTPVRTDDGWEIKTERVMTLALKDVGEDPKIKPPSQLIPLEKGTIVDSLAVSPDGSQLLFTILSADEKGNPLSQMLMMSSDGTGGTSMLSDGKSLDITPTFTPDGTQVVFSSNRGGRRLNIWSMSSSGESRPEQLTTGESNDLWPAIDSEPKPRLFYEARLDTRPDPRLYMTQIGTTIRTDLTQSGGTQPRVSPKSDSVLFVAVNEETGKRDIYQGFLDRAGVPVNLTSTPDIDEFDPAWSRDGSRIAFASDRGVDAEKRKNFNIWIIDVANPEQPRQLTTNGSWDDGPVWDPTGRAIYFRSNRGGDWGIWKINAR